MARQKKDSIPLNAHIERSIMERLALYCAETGRTKTVAVERAIMFFLDRNFPEGDGRNIENIERERSDHEIQQT